MNELPSRDNKILLCVWVLATIACVLLLLGKQDYIGFGDVVFAMLYACFVVWVWRQPSPRSKPRYEVVVVNQPDNNPIHLIERK